MGKNIDYIEHFKNHFEEYLNSIGELNLGKGTKKSYVTYMRNISRVLLDKYIKENLKIEETNSFIELFYRVNSDTRVKLLALVEVYIDNYLQKTSQNEIKEQTSKTKKTIQNYRSGFRHFTNMGYDFNEKAVNSIDKRVKDIINKKYEELDSITYTKKALDKVYIARLKTQDRSYDEIMFPIRAIWKFAKKHGKDKDILKVMQETLDKMVYYTSADGTENIEHKNIKKLTLNLKDKYVGLNQREKMFTEVFGKAVKELQKPIMASISIDHAKSLHTLMTGGNEKQYKKLLELSYDMRNFNYTCKRTRAAEAIEFFNHYENSDKYSIEFVKGLVKEVCDLFNKMQFVAMDKAQNSSKNDNI